MASCPASFDSGASVLLAERSSPTAVKLAIQVALTQRISKRSGLAHAHKVSQTPMGNFT
jgi:hypothetical protein